MPTSCSPRNEFFRSLTFDFFQFIQCAEGRYIALFNYKVEITRKIYNYFWFRKWILVWLFYSPEFNNSEIKTAIKLITTLITCKLPYERFLNNTLI